ncbi:uncharacterized protein LOC142351655 [Convolutriloba macropyga]|uniref:uncharacterized protein LOC142351655 n=1 Tax=Convolutriloba macropyga TaxID=536237 RepID=UPI003F51B8D7
MDQSSLQPQPQYVDSAIQSRVNPVTSSSNFEDTIGRPAVIHRERHKLKDCKGRTDHFVTRTAPTGAVTSAPAITNIPNSATASTIGATASTTASTQLFFGRPQPKQSTQIGQAPKEYVTCIPVHDLLPSACYAHTYITANKHPPIEIWSVHSIYTLTSAVLPSTFSTRSQSLARREMAAGLQTNNNKGVNGSDELTTARRICKKYFTGFMQAAFALYVTGTLAANQYLIYSIWTDYRHLKVTGQLNSLTADLIALNEIQKSEKEEISRRLSLVLADMQSVEDETFHLLVSYMWTLRRGLSTAKDETFRQLSELNSTLILFNSSFHEYNSSPLWVIPESWGEKANLTTQLKILKGMVEQNEKWIEDIKNETEKLRANISSGLETLTLSSNWPKLVSESDNLTSNDCFHADFPGPGTKVSAHIQGGPANVYTVEVLTPSVSGTAVSARMTNKNNSSSSHEKTNNKLAALLRLLLMFIMIGVLASNQFFIFSMWTDKRMDLQQSRLADLEGLTTALTQQHISDINYLVSITTNIQNQFSAIQNVQGQSTYDLGELQSDFDINNALISAQLAHLENQLNSLEVAILSGTANVGSGSANIINSTSINSSIVGTDEGGPQGSLQTQLMLAKIETNEMEIEKLKAENAIIMANLPAFQTGHGIGGSSDDVSIQLTLSSDTSEIVDGNEALSDCYFASVAGIDGRIFADISDGLSQVHYVDMLLPSTAVSGQVIEVYICIGYYCFSNCQNIFISSPGQWVTTLCSSPGEYIVFEQQEGYLTMCEVRAYGKPVEYL